ncbi:MAG: VOC family protein [Bacteroidota bacterium]
MRKAVVHFEIGCSDIERTSAFYSKVFNWNVIPQGNSAIIESKPTDPIGGHFNKLGPDDPQNYITVYIETDTLIEDLSAIEANGGKILVKPIRLPDGREFAWFEDVAGNTVGLITPAPL